MGKQFGLAKLAVAALLAAALLAPAGGVQAATWTDWSCQWAVRGLSRVSGQSGRLGVRPLVDWGGAVVADLGRDLRSLLQGDQYICPRRRPMRRGQLDISDVWQQSISYDTYGNIGSPSQGNYRTDCYSGHYYRAYYAGSRQATSSAPWEGTSNYVYY